MQKKPLVNLSLGDIFILGLFFWITGGTAYGLFQTWKESDLRRRKLQVTRKHFRGLLEGLTAIIAWWTIAVWLEWSKLTFILAIVGTVSAVMIVSLVNHRVGTTLFDRYLGFFELFETRAEWILVSIGVLMYGGLIYFFLFAPHGVLCILRLRRCGP